MAENDLKECPCSNITIMQLFHELKQRYPKIPDQVVSKVIEQNFHDKTACETILQRESHHYLQTYPGALILGNVRDQSEPLCKHCPVARTPRPIQESVPLAKSESGPEWTKKRELGSFRRRNVREYDVAGEVNCARSKAGEEMVPSLSVTEWNNGDVTEEDDSRRVEPDSEQMFDSSSSSLGTYLGSYTEEERRIDASSESSAVITDRTSESGCDSETKDNLFRSQSSIESSSLKGERGVETKRWNVEDRGRRSAVVSGIISHSSSSSSDSPTTHNYQVAVECSMQSIHLGGRGNREPTRSYTSVNLCLRPPSSEPQPPIEIQSGQSLTYTTSSFDPRKGYQSQLQIRIDPELLEKQRERKDLLARELRREKEKLRFMQNEVRQMQAAIAERPNPLLLPKLKADILRLRTECERLTAAVDLYSVNQNDLPLGETNEAFYRNIYTGQRFHREDSWNCQLCTFLNHPLLNVCEECGMMRYPIGTAMAEVTSSLSNVFSNNSNTAFCTGGGTSTSASLITAPLQER